MMTDQMKVDLFSLINGVSHTEGGLRVRGIIFGDFMAQNLTFVVFGIGLSKLTR